MGIGAGLVYLSIRGVTPDERTKIIQAFSPEKCNYFWVLSSMIVSALSHLLRAIRWRMLIEPIAKKPGLANSFFATVIGYMVNYAIPRLGEITRPGILAKYEKISFAEVIGTVILERVIDTLLLIVLFFVAIGVESKKAFQMINEVDLTGKLNSWVHSHLLIVIILLVITGIGLIILFRSKNKVLGIIKKYVESFWLGIKSVGKVKKPFLFWVYSVGIWMLYLTSAFLCFFCFAETSTLSIGDGLVLLIVGSIAVIITPGGTGAYQLLVINVLTTIYLISQTTATAFAWIMWGSQLILIVFLGLISLLLLPIINKNDDKTGVHQI